MRKLLLFGNNSEKSKLMKILHKEGCVEISLAQKLDNTSYVFDESKIEDINRKLTKIEFLFDFLLEGEKIAAKYDFHFVLRHFCSFACSETIK